jgi:transposase-like protein
MKRRKYTNEFVNEVLKSVKEIGINPTCRKYNISKSTLNTWRFPERNKKYCKKRYEQNREKRLEYRANYYKKNKKECIKKQIEYHKTHPEVQKRWYDTHKSQLREYMREYEMERKKIDPQYKLGFTLRHRVRTALKQCGLKKDKKIKELTGCSINHLKTHLESQFQEGMNWDNHGKWHIDHIRPCSSFNLLDPKEQQKCFHYTNLQPLWATDNLKKRNKYTLGVINCAATKKTFKCRASEMYDNSRLFRTMRDYCIRNYDEYVILSAYYGVLYPDAVIEPYKDTVMFVPNDLLHSGKEYHALTTAEKKQWAKNVVDDIDWDKYTEINFHCGGYYIEHILPLLEERKIQKKESIIVHSMKKGISNTINNYKE